jgi:hypothetical protein
MNYRALCGIVLFSIIAACVGGGGRKLDFLPPHINTVYFFSFSNESGHPELEPLLRQYLSEEFRAAMPFEIVDRPQDADLVVSGSIRSIFFQALTLTATGAMDKARYYLEMQFSFKDVRTRMLLIEEEPVSALVLINLVSPPVADLEQMRMDMVRAIARHIVHYAKTGRPENVNLMYGYEDQLTDPDGGILIGRERRNLDLDNDGLDDRLQMLHDSDGLTNIRAVE